MRAGRTTVISCPSKLQGKTSTGSLKLFQAPSVLPLRMAWEGTGSGVGTGMGEMEMSVEDKGRQEVA